MLDCHTAYKCHFKNILEYFNAMIVYLYYLAKSDAVDPNIEVPIYHSPIQQLDNSETARS